MDKFGQANSLARSVFTSWTGLESGVMEGVNYVCTNPMRMDSRKGSFKIHRDSGVWADFIDELTYSGKDFVALYSRLYESKFSGRSYQERQHQAAEEILKVYGGIDCKTTPKASNKSDFWAGYHQLVRGVMEVPKIDYAYQIKTHGPLEKEWDFFFPNGKFAFRVARFRDPFSATEGKKARKHDAPFTLWEKNGVMKWRSKALEGTLTPLYNLKGLMENENLPVLIVEGQKNAEESKSVLSDHFAVVSKYGKIEKNDLAPLTGKIIYLWQDNDDAGRRQALYLTKELEKLNCDVSIVRAPEDNKAKGWDISNAIEDGWSDVELINHIKAAKLNPVQEPEKEEVDFFTKDKYPFKILGITGEFISFISATTRTVVQYKINGLGKGSLMSLMSWNEWQLCHPGNKGPDWDAAADDIITKAGKVGIYDPGNVRGSGVWRDKGTLVCSTGEKLLIKNESMGLLDYDSDFGYKRSIEKRYTYEAPLSKEESGKILDIFNLMTFESNLQRQMLASWVFLAPFCGALDWRPHAWLTGSAGSGKSTVQRIVKKMLDSFSLFLGANGSTEAGMRQALSNCALPVQIDEMEGSDLKAKEMIQIFVSTARQASTGGENGPKIVKGSQDGQGSSFIVNCMFFFSSIYDSVVHQSDFDRIEILNLKKNTLMSQKERNANYNNLLEKERNLLTDNYITSFYSRALNIFPETQKAIKMFIEVAAEELNNRRAGDQKGTLLAGAYMITNDLCPTREEAVKFVRQFNIEEATVSITSKSDSENCLDLILSQSYHFRMYGSEFDKKQTVGQWIEDYFDNTKETPIGLEMAMSETGVYLVKGGYIDIATNHDGINSILKNTIYGMNYGKTLKDLDKSIKVLKPTRKRFAGITKCFVRINLNEAVIDEEPPF